MTVCTLKARKQNCSISGPSLDRRQINILRHHRIRNWGCGVRTMMPPPDNHMYSNSRKRGSTYSYSVATNYGEIEAGRRRPNE